MVGLVLVSHSRALALATQELVRSMTGPALPLAIAAGVGEEHRELGTDAVEISEAILSVQGPEGVVVLMDMGSAVLSSETALDLLDESARANITFCPAPFVEGAVAAGVTANLGAPREEVCREALASLQQKNHALAEKSSTPAPSEALQKADAAGQTIRLTVPNLHGLHARPAARLISETRPFHAEITVRNLTNQRGPVSVRSLSSLASLEILQDNEIEVAATGDDASSALEKISGLVKGGLGDPLPPRNGKAPAAAQAEPPVTPKQTDRGVPVAEGIAIGPGTHLEEADFEIPQNKIENDAPEIARLQKAVADAREALATRQAQMRATVGAAHAEIYEAQALALQDPELIDRAISFIRADHDNTALAWSRANEEIARRYESLQDPYFRARGADMKDIGRQVLEALGVKRAPAKPLSEPRILVAPDFAPSQIASLERKFVLGVILLDGGPTAHSSILLRALNIPTVVQAREVFAGRSPDSVQTLALDGSTGKVWLDPAAEVLADLRARQVDQRQRAAEDKESCLQPGATLDGHRVEILANIGHASEAREALQAGAEGVGLLRTEFLFLERDSAPTEEEQMEALRSIGVELKEKPLTVRTLDVGGDKKLPYVQLAPEENPFLGVRAIRLCFQQEDLFATQLRAILRAGHQHEFQIMFPMIADLSDLRRAKAVLEKVHLQLEHEKIPHLWPIKTGIMVEIPSAAIAAEALAEQVDFFSIGTNDLTQYALAADRGNPALLPYQDSLHPAVLHLIQHVVKGAARFNRPVAICGEAASDELAALIFVGLGVHELSMTRTKIARIKSVLRQHKLGDVQQLAEKALACHTAGEVRALLR